MKPTPDRLLHHPAKGALRFPNAVSGGLALHARVLP